MLNLDPYIDPDHLLALVLCAAVLVLSAIALIADRKDQREQASQSAEVEYALTEPAQEDRATAAAALYQPTMQGPAWDAARLRRSEVARRAPYRRSSRGYGNPLERRPGSRGLQLVGRWTPWGEDDQREASEAGTIIRDQVAVTERTNTPLFIGVGHRNA